MSRISFQLLFHLLMKWSNCKGYLKQTDLPPHELPTYPLKLFYLAKNTLPSSSKEVFYRNIHTGWENKEPNSFKKGDTKSNTKMIFLVCVSPIPCLWTRALCLCNKNWSDFPAISALWEDRFCSSLAYSADSLHNTKFLQVCYYVTKKSQSLLHQTKSILSIKHCTKEDKYRINIDSFNKGWGSPFTEGPSKAFLFLPVKMPVTPSLPTSCTLFERYKISI